MIQTNEKFNYRIKDCIDSCYTDYNSYCYLFWSSGYSMNELKAKYTNTASSFISVNGMDVHYRDEGDLSDTLPIVLIHGTGSSLHTFDYWADNLKKTNRGATGNGK